MAALSICLLVIKPLETLLQRACNLPARFGSGVKCHAGILCYTRGKGHTGRGADEHGAATDESRALWCLQCSCELVGDAGAQGRPGKAINALTLMTAADKGGLSDLRKQSEQAGRPNAEALLVVQPSRSPHACTYAAQVPREGQEEGLTPTWQLQTKRALSDLWNLSELEESRKRSAHDGSLPMQLPDGLSNPLDPAHATMAMEHCLP